MKCTSHRINPKTWEKDFCINTYQHVIIWSFFLTIGNKQKTNKLNLTHFSSCEMNEFTINKLDVPLDFFSYYERNFWTQISLLIWETLIPKSTEGLFIISKIAYQSKSVLLSTSDSVCKVLKDKRTLFHLFLGIAIWFMIHI